MNKYPIIDGIGEFRIDANTINTRYPPAIYVVHAMRWGSSENHSYIVLATHDMDEANKAAETEEIERGGKYGCEILSFNCGEKTIIRKPYDGREAFSMEKS